jgi:beta-lactam-binding protein with PASTA domain
LGKIGVVAIIALVFVLSFTGTVYLSLHSTEVKVPDIVGKDRAAAESALEAVGLNTRVRATRPSDATPDTILSQLPRAGETVKVGQTVAIDVSRAPKEGEVAFSAPGTNGDKPAGDQVSKGGNQNKDTASADQGDNQNKPKKNKNSNTNKNANGNKNSNANRNRDTIVNSNRIVNATSGNSGGGHNANVSPANRRVPVTSPSTNAAVNRRTP